jgi:hypothetical protein
LDTNIRIKEETRELLKEIGRMGQTYDQVINDLAKAKAQVKLQEMPITKRATNWLFRGSV